MDPVRHRRYLRVLPSLRPKPSTPIRCTVTAYYRIDDPALRRRLFELARALAVGDESPLRQQREPRVKTQQQHHQQRVEQISQGRGRNHQSDDEAVAGGAFAAAAAELLNAVNETLA